MLRNMVNEVVSRRMWPIPLVAIVVAVVVAVVSHQAAFLESSSWTVRHSCMARAAWVSWMRCTLSECTTREWSTDGLRARVSPS